MDSRLQTKLHLTIIYMGYQSVVDSLQWNVESTSKLDYESVNTPMDLNGPYSKIIYHDDKIYEGWIGSKVILVHKSVLVITQGCIEDYEQGLWIGLMD